MSRLLKTALLGAALLSLPSCTTEGFCFADCTQQRLQPPDAGPIGPTDSGPIFGDTGCTGFNCNRGDGYVPPTCIPSNGGVEVCDGKDNDCDDKVDESEFGKFGWVMDPDGNRIELWQPPG